MTYISDSFAQEMVGKYDFVRQHLFNLYSVIFLDNDPKKYH
jgi:hypothetical protein